MKPFIYTEMMVHVPMCTHKNPETALVITDDMDKFSQELASYKNCKITQVDVKDTLHTLRELEDKSFDVVLSEGSLDTAVLAHIARISKDDALSVMNHPDLDDIEANSALMRDLGRDFKIIMPYNVQDNTLLLASKEYHPTADIILQRSDLLEDTKYYNCDIHSAAFAMGNHIRKNYLGIIRN